MASIYSNMEKQTIETVALSHGVNSDHKKGLSKMEFKIKKIETFTNVHVSAVKLTMDDGSTGWGQMSTYCADITCEIFHRQIVPHILGVSFSSFESVENLILRKEHKFPGSYLLRAFSGIDTALWDWLGKIKGVSVVELLGGQPGKLRVYGSSMKRDITQHN